MPPGAKLPVQIPRHAGGYLHGTSYTGFAVDELRISADEVPTDGEFTVTVRVRNTGTRAGDEVVQLHLRDVVAQVTRPVRQLTGFARVPLEPGEAKDVRFLVHTDRTAFTGRDLTRIVEPGEIEILAGTSAADLPCRGSVRWTSADPFTERVCAFFLRLLPDRTRPPRAARPRRTD